MAQELQGRNIAILVADGFEQVELTEPKKALEEANARTHIVSPNSERVRGWNFTDWGDEFPVDVQIEQANPDDYHALMLPGGAMNPDKLRRSETVIQFVKAFFDAGKPVAAICHAPWTLIEAGVVEGREMTSFHSIKTDLINAGANWVDREVVVDGNLTTSRQPDDIEAFNRVMIQEFAKAQPTQELQTA